MIQILHPDGRVLQLDATVSVNVGRSATVAQHPLERGAPAVDHVEPDNDTVSISGKITESPTEGAQENTTAVEGYNVSSVTTGLTGSDRVQAASDFLRDCVGEFVDIVSSTGRFVYNNCLLAQHPYDFKLVRASEFMLQFVIPRIVNVEWTTIPALQTPAALQKDQETGAVATEEKADVDQSVLHRFRNGDANVNAEVDSEGKTKSTGVSRVLIPVGY